jgi:hypothetical protein
MYRDAFLDGKRVRWWAPVRVSPEQAVTRDHDDQSTMRGLLGCY